MDSTEESDKKYIEQSDVLLKEKYISAEQKKQLEKFKEKVTDQRDKIIKQREEKEIEDQAKQEEEKRQDKQEEQTKEQPTENEKLSKGEAKKVVYDYLLSMYSAETLNNPNVYLEHSSDTESGDYIFQLYEVVIDDPETKEGHTATWGWYAIDPLTKYVFDPF